MSYLERKMKLIDLVVKICNEYPEAANDDCVLLEQVWYAQGWSENRSLLENLRKVSRPESVSRRRREAHIKGLIEYSEEVDAERYEAYQNEKQEISNAAVSWLND